MNSISLKTTQRTICTTVALILLIATGSNADAAPICIKSASDKCFTDPFPPISSTDPLSVFDRATAIASECFYDQTFKGLDWNKEIEIARENLSDLSTTKEVQDVLSGLLGKLHASHTEYLLSQDQRYWALQSIFTGDLDGAKIYQIGATFEHLVGKWFVRSVFEKSPAHVSGLKRGDEIISVDDKPLSPVDSFSKVPPGNYVKVKFRKRSSGNVYVVHVRPVYESFQRAMFRATKASQRIFFRNGVRVGYVHLWAGTHDAFKNYLKKIAYSMEQNVGALILDIRDGLGGASPEYLDPFVKSSGPIFSKPLYLLINNGVKSGKESLAYILKTSKRATLIGTQTAGYYLGGRLFDINTGKNALYLAICGDSPVGVPLEGIGVSPDIEVPSPLPYSDGFDPQLQQALNLATKN